MSPDASHGPHRPGLTAAVLVVVAAIAVVVFACTPPRDSTPATPQSTIALSEAVCTA